MARNSMDHPSRRRPGFGGVRDALSVVAVALAVILLIPTAASAHSEYVVQPGDSLSVIAQRHGVSLSALAADNGISNLHLIRVGQVLRIPHGAATTYTDIFATCHEHWTGNYTDAPPFIGPTLWTGDPSIYNPTAEPNTHWTNWPDGGTL